MKNKNPILVFAALFALLFVVSFASAYTVSNNGDFNISEVSVPSSVSQDSGNFKITFTLDNLNTTDDLNITWTDSVSGGSPSVAYSLDSISSDASESVTATVSFDSDYTGDISGTIYAEDESGDKSSITFTVKVTSDKPSEILDCIDTGMPSDTDVRIKKIDFTNNGITVGTSSVTYGDENSWFPFEEIEVEIEVKNYGSYDVSDVEVSWGLWDEDAQEWVIEPDSEKTFDLDHGDTETLTVSFQLDSGMDMDLEDLSDGDTLKLYVYLSDGVVDDNDSPDDGDSFCSYDSGNAEMVIERNFVAVTDITVPSTVECDTTVQISGTLWNLGDKDQDDVSILVTNSQLGLSKQFSVGDIDALDNADFTFNLDLDESVSAGTYYLKFMVIDDDGDVYESDFDNDESVLNFPLVVTGDCSVPDVSVSASLQSGGIEGDSLVVKATVVNDGTKSATFSINAAGYTTWADSAEIDQPLLTIGAGDSKEVLITFNSKSDSAGEQTFNLEIVSDGQLVATQPVSVPIEAKSGIFSWVNLNGNWHIWAIGFLNLLLVIIIIIVAVRIARK